MTCITCQSENVTEVVENNRRYYHCGECQKLYERAIDSRYGRDVTINSENEIQHISVGAIIRDGTKILLLKRRAFPYGYDIPAGHVEYNEEPIEAVKREILEETALKVTHTKLLFKGVMKGNRCRYGADSHIWYVYECNYEKGIPILNPESEVIGWFELDEVNTLDIIPSAKQLFAHIFPEN